MGWFRKIKYVIDPDKTERILSRLTVCVERIGRIEEKMGEILEIHSHSWVVKSISESEVTFTCKHCPYTVIAKREQNEQMKTDEHVTPRE